MVASFVMVVAAFAMVAASLKMAGKSKSMEVELAGVGPSGVEPRTYCIELSHCSGLSLVDYIVSQWNRISVEMLC